MNGESEEQSRDGVSQVAMEERYARATYGERGANAQRNDAGTAERTRSKRGKGKVD